MGSLEKGEIFNQDLEVKQGFQLYQEIDHCCRWKDDSLSSRWTYRSDWQDDEGKKGVDKGLV